MPAIRHRCGALVLSVALGCGYTSRYVPPDNYRARPKYDGDQVVMVGPGALPKCSWEVNGPPPPGPPPELMVIDDRGYWSSGGVNVTVVHVGPLPPHWYLIPPGVPPSPGAMATHSALSSVFGGHGHGGGGGGGGGGDQGMAIFVVLLTAVAVVASVGVAVGLAADPPEGAVAEGIDQVNQYNDDARRKIAECIAQPVRPLAPPPVVPGSGP